MTPAPTLQDLIDTVNIQGDMRLSGDSIYAPGVDVIELRKVLGVANLRADKGRWLCMGLPPQQDHVPECG